MPAVRVIAALQGIEVFCRDKAGIFEGSIIRCKCCSKDFAPSAFENHSGSSFRRPWKSIKDITGKSIQEYREEQENTHLDVVEGAPTSTDEKFLVERIVSHRVKHGKKEYLVKWQNYEDAHNTWIPPENFIGEDLVQIYEAEKKKEKKRKADVLPKKLSTNSGNRKNGSPHKSRRNNSNNELLNFSPLCSSNDSASSPPLPIPLSPSDRDSDPYLEYPAPLEPLFDEASLDSPLNAVSEYDSSAVDEGDGYDLSDEDESDTLPISTITVDYEGMRGAFIQVATFRDLLECALEYWEMNELTSIKDWILTNETGAMWPLSQNVRTYSPLLVYLKRKPWR